MNKDKYDFAQRTEFLPQRVFDNLVAKHNGNNGVPYNQMCKMTGFHASKEYPEKIRRVKCYDKDTQRTLAFLTNNMELTA